MILNSIKREFERELVINSVSFNREDEDIIQKELQNHDVYDTFGLREKTWKNRKKIVVKECHGIRMIVVVESLAQEKKIPWNVWFHINYLFGNRQMRVVFFMNSRKREFPINGNELVTGIINGGYTIPCTGKTIVIYREEDATRVLLHELLHLYCTDRKEDTDNVQEAKTESWAEILYCGVLSRGKKEQYEKFIKQQLSWIKQQNNKIRMYEKNPVVWRYTIDKEAVMEKWGFDFSENNIIYENVELSLGNPFIKISTNK